MKGPHQGMCVCVGAYTHLLAHLREAGESLSAAAQEGVADRLAYPSILTGIGDAGCNFGLTAPPGELGTATAFKTWDSRIDTGE